MKQRHRAALVDRNTVIFPTNVCHPDEIIVQTDNDNQIEDEIPTNATSIEDRAKSESTSQRSLAIVTGRQKRVHHVPEAGTFVVEGSKGDKYTVEMLPKENCL